jgi:hypothetical protein
MGIVLLDLALAILATARLTRLVTTDSISGWWLRDPLHERFDGTPTERYVDGLDCPFCVGFWIGAIVLASLWLCHGPGEATIEAWRWAAGAFALNYLVGHLSARID